ncbi:hypothetical protein FOA52_004795 [Chlamydomonas sp. UWO 241]|nr:hypothetical protein FOA52_004795 [Chlamydomonas sp. UWO 241]
MMPRMQAVASNGAGAYGTATLQEEHSNSESGNAAAAPSTQLYDIDLGYKKDIASRYEVNDSSTLGKGGNGKVIVATHRMTGTQYACKIIPKVIDPTKFTERKCNTHIDSLRREVGVLKALRGTLSVVQMHDVYEDADNVWIVMEWCKGGELWHRAGDRHYSERTVASFMRSVLRTIAVMHSHNILHRDIKPGNWMLLNDSDRSAMKAIDFGLAMPFDPESLPLTNLGLEGTPWYMAPEVLSHSVTPASDLWSVGVMAAELLTGRLPFDDHANPSNARLSEIWRSVLCDDVDFTKKGWGGISAEGKAFVASLLQRDPTKRPTAQQALQHPWLKGDVSDRSHGQQLERSVVQRIQRYGQVGVLKRAVLQSIVEDLMDASTHGQMSCSQPIPGARPRVCDPRSAMLQQLFTAVGLNGEEVGLEELAERLQHMGFKLEASEAARLLEQLDIAGSGMVGKAAFAASQLDWRAMQQSDPEEWMRVAATTFAALDEDQDGILSHDDIASAMSKRMSEAEAQAVATGLIDERLRARALQAKQAAGTGMELARMPSAGAIADAPTASAAHASVLHPGIPGVAAVPAAAGAASSPDATGHGMLSFSRLAANPSNSKSGGMDFDDFVSMLRMGSTDTLDIYDDGLGANGSSRSGILLLNAILHGSPSGGDLNAAAALSSPGAAKLAPAGFFRFDPPSLRQTTQQQQEAQQKATPQKLAPPGFFRFDTGADAVAAPAPTLNPAEEHNSQGQLAPPGFFRFDVGGESGGGGERRRPRAAESSVVARASTFAGAGRCAGSSVVHEPRVRAGGYFDKRHRGASLYLNEVARCLGTVQECE